MTPRGRIALAAAGLLVFLLAASQFVLPAIAEKRLRDRLDDDGIVERVDVSAFPALILLGDRADRVEVQMAESRAGPGRLADLLASSKQTDELDARADRMRLVVLRLRDLRLTKDGRRLHGEATVTEDDLRAALPPGFDVRPVASGGGGLVFEGTVEFLGQRFSGRVVVAARDGRIVLAPDLPFGGFVTLTLFEDPRIEVTDVGARSRPDGFTVTADAIVRD